MKHSAIGPHAPDAPSLYGLRDLEPEDFGFAWNTPKSEHDGCYAYELHRQVGARLICHPKTHNPVEGTEQLRQAWVREFAKPWPQLSSAEKAAWKSTYKTTHPILWTQAGMWISDPAPDMPGELRVMKFDFDLSDAELMKRFRETLPSLRNGHMPIRAKTETAKDMLSAIAAQRLFDCRGDEATMNFVEAHTDRFTSELRFQEACHRYQNVENTVRIGFRADGSYRLYLDPAAYCVGVG